MKLKYKTLLYFMIGGTLSITACKKDLLNVQPTDRIATSAIESDTAVFEAFVTNRYIGERLQDKEGDGSNPGFGRGFEYSMWSSLTDESIYNNDDATWLVQRGQLAPENLGGAGVLWGRSYRSIRECNYALSILPNMPLSPAHKTRIEGELKFIRAFRYQDLIRNYGGIVLMSDKVTNLTDNLQDASLFKRVSIKESIDYAVAQLDDAASKLPVNNDGAWLLGRATKGAALALKSRLLLYAASPLYNAGTWASAVTAAQAVISLNKYGIYTGGYNNLFLINETNETIFARLYTKNANHTHLEIANGPNGYGGWAGNTPLQNLVDDYEMDNGKSITDPTSGYDANNPYVHRDPRFSATVLYNGATYRGQTIETFIPGGKDSKDGPDNWNTTKTGYYLKKFMNDAYPLQNPWGNAGFQPWIYFRYAEILLNFAEAANEAYGPDAVPAGSTLSARTAINQIRSRPGINMPDLPSGLSQSQMRDAVRYERRVELAFEEHRFYDVRRWKIAEVTENKPAGGIIITKSNGSFIYTPKVALDGRAFATKHYWLPIPRAEIQASGGQLQQNTGY
ncbi:RagB/SusD family nutrient uptake outer membrane protein [Mucilaginibacter sabulilitoris]|uniref:RagB/SusD family nutrient uptake outer membrane protein n=1 Tax=Mucilaginibacter sabulilitoris TaxID=1173583 RepID=A0ABZ0TN73_9SPHI|nr:RagB/SusD family nutrient uptake outer membrane protein [Mucilaginibacter sabulilitoris]WPU93169.1 RagB/SusD family nutrient uptake outer membrane protein [Mucilaginibacter sabulilitoris]